jgi:hypothetical protein
MPRPKGSKNNTQKIDCYSAIATVTKAPEIKVIPEGDGVEFMKGVERAQVARIAEMAEEKPIVTYDKEKYIIFHGVDLGVFYESINYFLHMNKDYVCQGGVSITNYRGLDGNIVFVYCQAMVKNNHIALYTKLK